MRNLGIVFLLSFAVIPLWGQEIAPGPSDPKAQKLYKEGMEDVKKGMYNFAVGSFKKADKLEAGRCFDCQQQIIKCGIQTQDWKAVEAAANEEVGEAGDTKSVANAHYAYGLALMSEGINKKKPEIYERAHEEMSKAIAADPNFPQAVFNDGLSLARANHDDLAKAQFEHFIRMVPPSEPYSKRAQRFIQEPDLARGKMAPAFVATLIDGQRVSLDDLAGKVVLIDFWATWCGPCREALPHMKEIAAKFQGQPLVILSISLDNDEKAWKTFVAKNRMTWLQCNDGGFEGRLSKMFGVEAIPHTFTIDADGMLQNEAVGDSALEGKLKKLIARAVAAQENESIGTGSKQ